MSGPKKTRSRVEQLGVVIREARLAKGLSQSELAKLMGFRGLQFISDWERGVASVPMKRLAELARHLDLPRDRLFDLLLEFSIDRLKADLKSEYKKTHRRRS